MKRINFILLAVFALSPILAIPVAPAVESFATPDNIAKGDICYVREDSYAFTSKKYAQRYACAVAEGNEPPIIRGSLTHVGGGGGREWEWKEDVVEEAKKKAVPIQQGTKIKVVSVSGDVVKFRKKKREYFIAARDLTKENEWPDAD